MGGIDTVATILGWCGNVSALVLFLSPVKTFNYIRRKKSTEEYSGYPYVTTLLNCLLWVLYGLPVNKGVVLIMTINGSGIVIQLVYVLMFLLYASSQKTRLKIFGLFALDIAVIVTVGLSVILGVHDKDKRITIFGILCVLLNIGMYWAPLSIMFKVIKTKSVRYMPFFLSLMVLINSVLWTIYGALKGDIYVIIPNALGLVGGVIQMVLYFWFCKSKESKADAAAKKAKPTTDIEMQKHNGTMEKEAATNGSINNV